MIQAPTKHVVAIAISGVEVRDPQTYEIQVSMTDVPGTFTMHFRFTREGWDTLRPDRPCLVTIDGVPVISGFIEDSHCSEDGDTIEVSGRCRMARLQESAPTISFAGLGIQELAQKLASPWFSAVTLSNAQNRNVSRGKGKKARAASEPVKINTRVGTQIEPGQSRFEALERLLEQAGLLMWSSGDGRKLVIGKPNYDQEIQYRFYRPAEASLRARDSTILGMRVNRSTGDRFSRVIVVGSGAGTTVNYGSAVAARYGEAKNNPLTVDGEGKDFIAPKRLIVVRAIKSIKEANELAKAEMSRRDASGSAITVRCAGHGQLIGGTYLTIFAIDTLAAVHDEVTGTVGVYTVVSCSYGSGRGEGEETTMELVRKGTEITR